MWGNLVGGGVRWERKSRLKESLLLGGQLEEDFQGEEWKKRAGGGEMREGFREEESGLRT